MILLQKYIGQWFYYKNAIDNDFTIKNALDNDFIIKIHWTMILL